MHVINFGSRRVRARLAKPHDTPPDRPAESPDGLREAIRQHPLVCPEGREVAPNDPEGCGVEILVRVLLDLLDGHAEPIARDGLILEGIRPADRLGVESEGSSASRRSGARRYSTEAGPPGGVLLRGRRGAASPPGSRRPTSRAGPFLLATASLPRMRPAAAGPYIVE